MGYNIKSIQLKNAFFSPNVYPCLCALTVYDAANDEPAAVPEGETGNVHLVKKCFIGILENTDSRASFKKSLL